MAGKRRPKKETTSNVNDERLVKPFYNGHTTNVDSELLRESEEKFRILTEMSAAAIFFHQGKKFIYANPAAENITGYTHDEILNANFWEIMAPEYQETVKVRGLARLSGDNSTPRYEVKIITKQGQEKWLDLSSARMDYRGSPAIMATALDITERKRADEAIRKSESRFRSYFDMRLIGIAITSPEKGWILANDKICEMLGYTREELTHTTWDTMTHPEDLSKDIEQFNRLLSGSIDNYSLDKRFICKNQDIIDTTISIGCVRKPDGSVDYIVGLMQDITERKRAEEAVRKSNIRFQSLIQNSSDIIRILDKEGRIIYDSPSSGKILGYPPGYMLGRSPFDFIHPDDLRLVREEVGTVYEKRNTGIPVEFRIRKASGEYLWVESIGVNMIGVQGVDGIVITTRPIGDRKKGEEELKAAKQHAELYLDLMSHDITNMNQVGMGFLELALNSLELDEPGREMLLKPMQAFEGSTRLINNVRKLQKAKVGEYKDKIMDVGQVLQDIQSHYSDLDGRNIIINYLPDIGYRVMANELLYDLFSNLVGNSIKHSNGSIIIDINVKRSRENDRDYYTIAIEDNGHGIKDDLKPVIFDRKFIGDIRSKGSGIGLFLVKTLVECYHGKVWVEDRVKGDHRKGARFVVMLPAVEK
jgi:PAS domain S-box-containing protein